MPAHFSSTYSADLGKRGPCGSSKGIYDTPPVFKMAFLDRAARTAASAARALAASLKIEELQELAPFITSLTHEGAGHRTITTA
jgi:hypothetical protein